MKLFLSIVSVLVMLQMVYSAPSHAKRSLEAEIESALNQFLAQQAYIEQQANALNQLLAQQAYIEQHTKTKDKALAYIATNRREQERAEVEDILDNILSRAHRGYSTLKDILGEGYSRGKQALDILLGGDEGLAEIEGSEIQWQQQQERAEMEDIYLGGKKR